MVYQTNDVCASVMPGGLFFNRPQGAVGSETGSEPKNNELNGEPVR